MIESTDHGDGTDRDGEDGEGTANRAVTAWHLVPTAPAGTVPVRWTDLKTMRRRIDELERERDRLAARLEQSRERRRRTVGRYERLLGRRPGTETTRPRVATTADGDAGAGAGRWRVAGDGAEGGDESAPTVAADGGFEGGPNRGAASDSAGEVGPLSRLVGTVVGLFSRE